MASYVNPLRHIILIPSQPFLLFLLNAACLAEKQQMPILIYIILYMLQIFTSFFILWFDTINEINENCYTTNNKEFTVQCIYILISMFTVFFQSRESSVSSSPKSGSVNLSNTSTPAGTPGMYAVVYNTSWFQFTKHKKKTPKIYFNSSHVLRRTHRI